MSSRAENPQLITSPPDLPRDERTLFAILARRPDYVWTKDELVRATGSRSTGALDASACRLRESLKRWDCRRSPVNVWGVGYVLNEPQS
jgi:DNA-binding response OmpR family regulator